MLRLCYDDTVLDRLPESPIDTPASIPAVSRALTPAASRVHISGLSGSAPAHFLASLRGELAIPVVVVAPDQEGADEFRREYDFYCGNDRCSLPFPAWDTAPLEKASPLPEISGRRLDTLLRLAQKDAHVVVTTAAALLQRVLPREAFRRCCHYLLPGEETDREALLQGLVDLGYVNVPLVEDRGSFSVRGGIIDVFPPSGALPVRIEFFGDEVETIRTFDPTTQRSLHALEELLLLPSREIVLNEGTIAAFLPRLKERSDELGILPGKRRELQEQVQARISFPGIELLQPLFYPGMESLFDYLGSGAAVVLLDPLAVEEAEASFREEAAAGMLRLQEKGEIHPRLDDLYLTPEEMRRHLEALRLLSVHHLEVAGLPGAHFAFATEDNRDLRIDLSSDAEEVLRPLADRLQARLEENWRIIAACHQRGQAERLHELLAHYGLPAALSDAPFPAERARQVAEITIISGEITRGFRNAGERLAVIAEEEIFGKRVRRRGITEARRKQILTSLEQLRPGDLIVHVDHGIGVYRGLQHLKLGEGMEGDFLLLEYAGADKLYLPVHRINLVQRYVGAEGVEPRVDRLGGSSWERTKEKAQKAVEEMAQELLEIYASRQLHEGHAFSPPDDLYREFEASFKYEETADQLAAIQDVLDDMMNKRPMDRLVCGDVGYGKTEVALRAAFKAVLDGKQVAVLVPTTVLAQQHLETFRERLQAYPVTAEMISRFRTAKEQKEILERLKKGEVDIVIGTHRLLQNDVAFRDLGLVIVDEEQRFGVVHKERLKKFRAVVDVLTLTATPIPRTLYMSMMGIRDLSIIDTPPVDRLAVKTCVARFTDDMIREAALRELRRGGQIFFVHNRVQSIGAMEEYLRAILPEAKIAVGHGQMDEKELEKVMLSFMHGETNLLLCTTIIESGLDIPAANTLIVNRADTFGLSQLYQLRGRVGRSKLRAFAYFLIPGEGALTPEARERLKILQDLSELGAGFRIATHDLELRGAGDLLGGRQSGNIVAVGFELYTELLEETIQRLSGQQAEEKVEPEIKLRVPAFIPEDFVADPNQRLVIYKKLTQAASEEEIDDLRAELVDRFGKLPLAAMYLLEVMKIRLLLRRLLIKEAEFDGRRLVFSFHEKTSVSPDTILGLIRSAPKRYSFTPDFRLLAEVKETSFDGVLRESTNLLRSLV